MSDSKFPHLHEPTFEGEHNCLHAIEQLELAKDAGDMRLDGARLERDRSAERDLPHWRLRLLEAR
jgi:hypothetical protein